MLLVVDANVIMSALVARGRTLDLFFYRNLQLFVPDFIFTEIKEHKKEILRKSGLSEREFELFINLIITRVKIVSAEEIRPYIKKAKEVSPDPDDSIYFALALKMGCPIWSNDKTLKQQSAVRILSTQDILRLG